MNVSGNILHAHRHAGGRLDAAIDMNQTVNG